MKRLLEIFRSFKPAQVRYFLFTLGSAGCVVIGLVPLVVMAGSRSQSHVFLSSLSCLGWLAAGMLLMRQRQIYTSVRSAIDSIGLAEIGGSLTEVIENFSNESARYHKASYGLRVDRDSPSVDLSESLQSIVSMAYHVLPAQSVELSLYDEASGMWAKSLILGAPKTTASQSMLVGDADTSTQSGLQKVRDLDVVCEPITFAGTAFGALRIEIVEGHVLKESDKQVLRLLAAQGGITLVDARFTDEMLRMRQLNEESTQAKTGFLANLSHELRGPLGIILNGIELAMDGLCGEVSEPLHEMLRMVKDSGDHLLDLVNDVLDYAKVEAGKVSARAVSMPLKPLLEDLCAVVRTQAHAKQHSLKLAEIDPALGIQCDKRHARQMLINFLTNAIKYTPEAGSIEVSVEKLRSNRVKIIVKDNGIGIPENEQSKVFGAFERVEHGYAVTQMGTGLGMPLTQKLASVNSGSVGFSSKEGEGSSFWLILPLVEGSVDAEPSVSSEETVSSQGSGELVLLVDHNNETREMLSTYLLNQGFQVKQAASGSEVASLLRSSTFDLAIIENDLPDLPGEEMVTSIRSIPNNASTPIVLLSARAFVFDIERFLKLGVDRCLSKPVSLAELALTARRLIDQNRNFDETTVH